MKVYALVDVSDGDENLVFLSQDRKIVEAEKEKIPNKENLEIWVAEIWGHIDG